MVSLQVTNNWTYWKFDEGVSNDMKGVFLNNLTKMFDYDYVTFYRGFDGPKAVDKSISLASRDSFPTGLLLPFIKSFHPESPIYKALIPQYNFVSQELKNNVCFNRVAHKFSFEFYLKQDEAIKEALRVGRGYIKAATGAGKTAMMAKLAAEIGGLTLVIEPTIDLVDQIQEEFEEVIIDTKIGFIQGRDSLYELEDVEIVVASVDTLGANFAQLREAGWFKQFTTLLLDEGHHAGFTKEKSTLKDGVRTRTPSSFTTYYNVSMECDAYWRFGFTATPGNHSEDVFLRACTGDMLYEIDEDYLIEIGRLAKPYYLIYKHKVPYYDREPKAKKENIYLNDHRNYIMLRANEIVEEMKCTSLIMIDSIKHQLDFIKPYVDIPIIIGKTKKADRKIVYDKLRSGEIKSALLSVGKEGLNIPSVDCIIRGAGRKSERLVVQETGRGKRAKINKERNRVVIVDFFDDDGSKKSYKRGRGWRNKTGFLKKHSQARLDIYRKSKYATVKIVETEEEFERQLKEWLS